MGSPTIDWSQSPFATPGQYYGVNKPMWQQAVGADENWIQKEMGQGYRIGGNIPGMFRGDILDLNRYGQFGDFNTQNNTQYTPHTHGPGTWSPMSQSDISALNNYQNWAYGQENQPGGGAVQAWGQYQGYGPNTAANDWGGAYSAYSLNQALQRGDLSGGSAPLAKDAAGNYGTFRGNGVWDTFNQYGIPQGSSTTFQPAGQGAPPAGAPPAPGGPAPSPQPAPTPQPNVPFTQPIGQPYNPWEQKHQTGAFPSNTGAPLAAPNPWDSYRMRPRQF